MTSPYWRTPEGRDVLFWWDALLFWWDALLIAGDHIAPGPDSPDEAHEDFYQRQRDEGDREQVGLYHGREEA